MANLNTAHGEIQNPGKFETPANIKTTLLVFTAFGIASFAFGLVSDPGRAWMSFIQNHFFFMSLAVGGLFFATLQWITGAMWSAPVRRICEAFSSYLPFALLTVIVLYFGIHHLYSWSNPSVVAGDPILVGKSGYLSSTFFMVRNVLSVVIWIVFARAMVKNSLAQDTTRDSKLTLRNRVIGPIFLILFALTYTMSSFDQIMSLDPHWYSTMFGIYCFAGLFYTVLAVTCLLTIYLMSKGRLTGIVNENHLHDIGKFMFAFTIFYAYIGFSQFLLIWYANLPEETGYYIKRFHESWFYVSCFLVAGKFATPFVFLLPRDSKRNPKILVGVAIFMVIANWIDILWMVQPEFFTDGPRIGIIEIGMTLGFLGVFGLFVANFLAKNNIVAIGDPRLAESVHHHHQ